VICASPFASKNTSKLLQVALGGVLSTTSILVVHSSVSPDESVTVSVTVFVPGVVKVDWESTLLTIPQLSAELLSISEAVIVSVPLLKKNSFPGAIHFATGEILSFTVIVAIQVSESELSSLSITVSVTSLLLPISSHVKLVWLKLKFTLFSSVFPS